MKKMKQGITVAMTVTMVLVILLLTTTITISVSSTLKSSNLKAFATELSLVKETLDAHMKSTSSTEYISKDITITPPDTVITTQFSGETITNGSVILHAIDLEKIGLSKTVYGNLKTEKDVYAISFETKKIYYVEGYDASDVIYYTLTQDLINLVAGQSENNIISNNISFVPNKFGWTNESIQVKVKIPTQIDISTVNVTTNITNITISDAVLNGEYNEITVNTENYAGNYIITMEYILGNETKTQSYEVANYDSITPVLTFGNITSESEYKYLNDVVATDNAGIKKIMYAEIEMSLDEAKQYFKNNGKNVINGKIRLNEETQKYTIYAEDDAGNVAILTVIIPSIGDLVDYSPSANPTESYSGATYVKDTVTTSLTYNKYIEQTINTYTPGEMTWAYLGQDESGNILLTSTDVTPFTMTLGGGMAYNYGPTRMNELCNTLYGNIDYGTARNMTIEDVNKILEYDGSLGEYTNSSKTEVKTPKAYTIAEIESIERVTLSHRKIPIGFTGVFEDILSDYYEYNGAIYKSNTTNEYKVIFEKAEDSTKLVFWLSSNCCQVYFPDNVVYYYCRYVTSGHAGCRTLGQSLGNESEKSQALRPVIVLNSNIIFGEKNDRGEWTLVQK